MPSLSRKECGRTLSYLSPLMLQPIGRSLAWENVSFGSRRVEAVTPVATSAIQNIDAEINDAR